MTALEGLLRLVAKQPDVPVEREFIVVDGFRVDPATGLVAGQYLCIEEHDYLKQPLFIYNRSVRFEDLVWRCEVPAASRARVLEFFCLLEQIWEAHISTKVLPDTAVAAAGDLQNMRVHMQCNGAADTR